MSLPSPHIWRLWTPPAIPPCCSASSNVNSALFTLNARVDAQTTVRQPYNLQPIRLLTLHPSLPLCAYIVADSMIVVQDLESGQVLGTFLWMEIAGCLYGEKNASKLAAAMTSLGKPTQLTLMDTQSIFWEGIVCMGGNNSSNTSSNPFWLVVQTHSRILVLSPRQSRFSVAVLVNQHKATRQAWFVSHLHEKSLGGVPSSNLLPLDAHTWLVGCSDGSLKAWDKNTHAPTKSIKGLGKGDWIVQILGANRYSTTTSAHVEATSSAVPQLPQRKRILTVTKKNTVYLIEMEANPLEIKPPLARFVLPDSLAGGEDESDSSQVMEHTIVSYDAHRDWVLWLVPSSKKSNPITTLLIWNLRVLQPEFIKHAESKTMFRPEANLTIQFPSSSVDSAMTVLSIVHPSFSDSTTVCAVASSNGDVYLQAALASPNNTKTIAVPVMGIPLSQLLLQTLQLDSSPKLQVTSMQSQPLGERSLLVLTTNYGVLALEWVDCLHAGSRHLHFGSGLGSLGKSVLYALNSEIRHASLDVLRPNPVGYLDAGKNPVVVYDSPPAMHFPADFQRRPFRIAPTLLPSPSGQYVAVFWDAEFRYEILHIPSVLQKVTQRNNPSQTTANRNPVVANGTGVTSFAWVGDQDDYAIIHADDVMQEAAQLMATAPLLVVPTAEGGLTLSLNPSDINMGNLMDIRAGAMGAVKGVTSVANLATSATLNATKAATNVTLSATKAATNVTLNATKAATDATLKVTMGTFNATTTATKVVTKSVTKGIKKSLGFSLKKKKTGDSDGPSTLTADDDDEDGEVMTADGEIPSLGSLQALSMPSVDSFPKASASAKRHYVELRTLVTLESQSTELIVSIAAATSSGLGELMLRGGNRNRPTVLFGGPVLLVASREDQQGHAHFYTRKLDEKDNKAGVYVSAGPTIPFPDLCEWDEDGILCAVVLQNRIAVYLSDPPNFTLLGMLRMPSTSKIVSVKFIHGVIYCTTWNSVHCVFLGSLDGTGICHMDMYTLASATVSTTSDTTVSNEYTSIVPPSIPLPLVQPVVLGYQSGSLVVSTTRGIYTVPLSHPLLRIGTLLAAGQAERAAKWLDAFPNKDHEALATFLERRGHVELAFSLPGLSLETIVDMSMRFGYVARLEAVIEEYGVKGLRAIDMSRGVSTGMFGPERHAHSVVVCVGAYLLAHGKVELTRRLATELLRSGEEGKKEAFLLASLLLAVDEADASRLISRAVESDSKSPEWLIGNFLRDHVLSSSKR